MPSLDEIDPASLKVVKYPHPALLQPSRPVAEFGPALEAVARRMLEIMYASGGVGLAAPQVGLPLQMFVANLAAEPGGEDEGVYVNPRIVARDGEVLEEEGCLSCPGVRGRIKRSASITLRACDVRGREFEQTGEGLLARIFQHETDHLAGTLIVNRMSSVARLANRRTLRDLEADYAAGGGR